MPSDHSYLITVSPDAKKRRWTARPRSNNPGVAASAESRDAALRLAYASVLRDLADRVNRGDVPADDLTVSVRTEGPWRSSSSR